MGIVNSTTNQKDCFIRRIKFSFCLEGKIGNKIEKCLKCVKNSNFNNKGICECDFDSFGKRLFYDKCDDELRGYNVSKGCSYDANSELNCNECKEGYFEYTKGKCFSCLTELNCLSLLSLYLLLVV